jgi:Na+-transporting methylmalonyl-CoA/oxaloacetate decarboxylase beta subunit
MKQIILIIAILLIGLSCTKEKEEPIVILPDIGSITVYYNNPLTHVIFGNEKEVYEYSLFTCETNNNNGFLYTTSFQNIKIGLYRYIIDMDYGGINTTFEGYIQVNSGNNNIISIQ